MAAELTRCPHGRWVSDKLHCRECLGLGTPTLHALFMDVQAGAAPSEDERFTFTLAESEGLLSPVTPRQRGRPEFPRLITAGWTVKP